LEQKLTGGHAETVRLLLERGANPYYATFKGWDVLQFAEMGENAEVQAMVAKLWEGKDPNFHRTESDDE
jgi:ankyrin repeat protein